MSVPLHVLQNSLPAEVLPPAAPEAARRPGQLLDSHGRVIRDLRLSVTDRCNFRCVYCMDPDYKYMPKQELLAREEYERLVRICLEMGVEKVRVTGGEPTLYPPLDVLLGNLGKLGPKDLAMTTNGTGLTRQRAERWRELGLRRITLSLDSVDSKRMQRLTRSKSTIEGTIAAINNARDAGLGPIKINAVVMRGINDCELVDLATFAREHDVDMRFIEFMPLDSSRAWVREDLVTADEMIARISERYELTPLDRESPDVTSTNFTFADGAPGRIGVIASVTRPFCGACSRLRLTADGKIRPCLFSHREWDLRPLLRGGADDEAIKSFLIDATWTKQAGHGIGTDDFAQPERTMSAIGG